MIHGGPGDIGGMRPVAERLGKTFGVIEPIQSQYTTIALVMELRRQLGLHIKEPITLIGHSWGAWLSLLVSFSGGTGGAGRLSSIGGNLRGTYP